MIKPGDTGRCRCGCEALAVVIEVRNQTNHEVIAWIEDSEWWRKECIFITSYTFTDEEWASFVAARLSGELKE